MADYEYSIETLESTSTKKTTVNGHLGDLGEDIVTATGLKGIEVKFDDAVITEPKPSGLFKKTTDYPGLTFESGQWTWDYYVLYERDNTVTVYRMPGERQNQIEKYRAELEKAQNDYENASAFKKAIASGAVKVAQASLNQYTDPQDMGAEKSFCDAIEHAVSTFGTGYFYNDGNPVSAPAQWQGNGAPAADAAPTQPAAAPAAGGFCGNCGAPIKPGSKFCTSCGAKL